MYTSFQKALVSSWFVRRLQGPYPPFIGLFGFAACSCCFSFLSMARCWRVRVVRRWRVRVVRWWLAGKLVGQTTAVCLSEK